MQPEVSIIMPCYNQAEYLPDALESVLAQTFSNWECIVVSDGSPDNVRTVVSEYVNRDPRIIFYDTENGGVSAARNFAISKASGTFILPLDADDRISANYVEECVQVLSKDAAITLVYGSGEKFGLVEEPWKLKPYSWKALLFGNMIHPCGMFRKADWKTCGGYDERMLDGIEDWEFWINLLQPGKNVRMLSSSRFYHRVNPVSRTTRLFAASKEAAMKRYVYCKHAALYEPFFDDPLKLYEEREYYKQLWQWVTTHPLRYFFSVIKKQITKAGSKDAGSRL